MRRCSGYWSAIVEREGVADLKVAAGFRDRVLVTMSYRGWGEARAFLNTWWKQRS